MYGNTDDWCDDEPSAALMHDLGTVTLGGNGFAYGEWEVHILEEHTGRYWADGREGMLEGPFRSVRQTFLSVGLGDYQYRKWRDPSFWLTRGRRRRTATGPNPWGDRTSIWTRTWQERPNYFGELSQIDYMLSRLKSNEGRIDLAFAAMRRGVHRIAAAWRAAVQPRTPGDAGQARDAANGGDLPDLAPGQVEIARLTSRYGDVTSLRATRIGEGPAIRLKLVGGGRTSFRLAKPRRPKALTEAEVLAVFQEALQHEPGDDGRVTSFFYRGLMCPEVADALNRGGGARYQAAMVGATDERRATVTT